MFDQHHTGSPPCTHPDVDGPVDAARLAGWSRDLARVDHHACDAERIDQIRALEELKSAAAAAQAELSDAFDASQREVQAHQGVPVPAKRQGRGIANQVALARRESPHRGHQHLGLAQALVAEMPHTLAALRSGHLNEWRATLLVRETASLTRADRATIDRAIAADTDTLDELGDRGLITQTRRLAYQADPHSVVDRARRAQTQRRVTTRPAPETMGYLTALLPVAQAVACHAALTRAADTLTATGDARSRGQIMADVLVERLTGQTTATDVPIEVHLVTDLQTLLGDADHPAHLDGHGPVPAGTARDLLRAAADHDHLWLRRLFTRPETDDLVAMDSHRRTFPAGLARFIRIRDQVCRTPWREAPIRHTDHITPHQAGGTTSTVNGQGLCEACNHAKQAPNWHARPRPGPHHPVETTTPTGHHYHSTTPPPPATRRADPGVQADPGAQAHPPNNLLETHLHHPTLAT